MKNANPVSRLAVAALLVALPASFLVACARENSGSAATTKAAKSVSHFFPIKVGDKVVRLQLAVRAVEMQRGLMDRRDLGRNDGMLFVYEKPQLMSFWMRNTPTPLDIGFFGASGVLEEVYPLHPFDETAVASRGRELQFALEVNQGWYRENGVKPGAKLDLQALIAALKERGFDPRKFGL